ncbi:DMT family transporter [Sphaerotilus sp.]|uniref:DMT family transporter n=1 Tax=Sphaerotilus sp. TaxID=2093942 RepID=UPI0034E278F9
MTLTPRLIAMLTLPPLMWAGNAVVGRLTVPHVPPLMLNAIRWGIVLLVLLVLGRQAIATAGQRREILARWRPLGLMGLLGVGAYNALQYLALTTSTPINVTLIAASMPLWMLLVGAVFYAEHPRGPQMVGATLSLVGVATVLSRGQLSALADVQFVRGDMYMLAAAASWAGYSWMLARPPASMRGAARPNIIGADGQCRVWTWDEALLVQALFGVVWAGGAAGLEAVVSARQPEWSLAVGAAVVYIVIGPSLIAYALWGRAVAAVGPTTAGIFANLTPLFAALLSTALLGEAPHGYHAVAFALIVAGILVSSRR